MPDYWIPPTGVQPGVKVVILNPDANGVQQIADYLQQHHVQHVDAVSIVADGADGELQLGTTLLSASNVASYQPQLAEIGAALKPGGDLLIYGCDVAQNSAGDAFLGELATATGLANIASCCCRSAPRRTAAVNLDVGPSAPPAPLLATGPFTAATVAALYPDLADRHVHCSLVCLLPRRRRAAVACIMSDVNGGTSGKQPNRRPKQLRVMDSEMSRASRSTRPSAIISCPT